MLVKTSNVINIMDFLKLQTVRVHRQPNKRKYIDLDAIGS